MSDSNRGEAFWLSAWYQGRWWLWLLWPLSLLFRAVTALRRRRLAKAATPLSVPVMVIGNISLGGTGKTPLIISLVHHLHKLGLKPGVISRGYGGLAPHYPYYVTAQSPVGCAGDEPLLIAREAQCPVVVGSDRVASARALIDCYGCDLILSDDGLQHYRLSRQWEVCVVDGSRGIGNGLCLPAGPLREPASRLNSVDAIFINGANQHKLSADQTPQFPMQLAPICWRNVLTGEVYPLAQFASIAEQSSETIYAVTGIGNPERFFDSLGQLGLASETQAFPDHHPFTAEDLAYAADNTLLMTAKDAVKCQSFAKSNWWYLSIEAQIPPAAEQLLSDFLKQYGLDV